MSHLIAPSILTADFTNLRGVMDMLNSSDADWIHLDIMDGAFVPNITFGFDIIRQIRNLTSKPLDVHLMIVQPDRHIERFRESGADILGVHYETCEHLHRTVNFIRKLGMRACVVVNPHTGVMLLEDILPEVDQVLVMSVNPGFGGQQFIENSYSKISKLKDLILRRAPGVLIEVDGGVSLENASLLFQAGADILVAGNTIFASTNPVRVIAELRSM